MRAGWKEWASPRHVYLDTNATCNLKCIQCDIHHLKNPPNELSLEERLELIGLLGRWDTRIQLHLAGGEPFLRRQEVYSLAAAAKQAGISMAVNTNGSLLKSDDFPTIPGSGISTLVFSLDSHRPEVHDQIRGVKGTFARVETAVKETVKANLAAGRPIRILLSAILGSHNLGDCSGLFRLVGAWGVDALIFQPIQPVFERTIEEDWASHTPLWPENDRQVNQGIAELISLKAAGAKTFQTQKSFRKMESYFLGKGQWLVGDCISMRDHMMIDGVGDVRFCFGQDRLNEPVLGNVRTQSLQIIWESSRERRFAYRDCGLECGAMLCHGKY